jgi:hypothetical protein
MAQTVVKTKRCTFEVLQDKKAYVRIIFNNGQGAEFFAASGCDADDGIDELISIDAPSVSEKNGTTYVTFCAKTTLWQKAEYIFEIDDDKVVYYYKVYGSGNLEIVRFFEGFLYNNEFVNDKYFPYFCGPGRHMALHRDVKEFMSSSKPLFKNVYSYGINSQDKRVLGFYEDMNIRVNGDRHYFGGDWLATPAPFMFLCGDAESENWFTTGLAVKPKENRFMGFKYCGGEGFGFMLDYMGQTQVKECWESPKIVMQTAGEDKYAALSSYFNYLVEEKCVKSKNRENTPKWWKQPIFGGWGEQVFHSNRWDNFFSGKFDDWKNDDTHLFCTQEFYEKSLERLEAKGINPGILIIDNRWYDDKSLLDIDENLWPDLKGFIETQHKKGRKVILWSSPWSLCQSAKGKTVPLEWHAYVDENELYDLELDTDVFYEACKREHKKTRKYYPLPEATHTDANWRYVANPYQENYRKMVEDKINNLLSPNGLNADGFEFDYTHFIPKYRGTKPICESDELCGWGVEIAYDMIKLYYDAAKKAKEDALIISHTFNPYFNDIVDMLRLQDIYTDFRFVSKQMNNRAQIGKAVCPGCDIHTDQHPMPSLEAWREYALFQPQIGNPCLYYVSGIETTREKFEQSDYDMICETWAEYRKEHGLDG